MVAALGQCLEVGADVRAVGKEINRETNETGLFLE